MINTPIVSLLIVPKLTGTAFTDLENKQCPCGGSFVTSLSTGQTGDEALSVSHIVACQGRDGCDVHSKHGVHAACRKTQCLLPCREVETAPESACLEDVLEQLKKSKRKLLPVADSQGNLVSMGDHPSTCSAHVVCHQCSCASSTLVLYVKGVHQCSRLS